MKKTTPLLLLLVLVMALIPLFLHLKSQPVSVPLCPKAPESMVAGHRLAAVAVHQHVGNSLAPSLYASGVLLGRDGLVLTNRHAVERPEDLKPGGTYRHQVCQTRGGVEYCRDAKVLAISDGPDLALLQVEGLDSEPIEIRPDDEVVREGEEVFARLGFGTLMSPSLVFGRYVSPYPDGYEGQVHDISSALGSSGGPIFDLKGRLVGIVRAITKFEGRTMTIAVPMHLIRKFLLDHGYRF